MKLLKFFEIQCPPLIRGVRGVLKLRINSHPPKPPLSEGSLGKYISIFIIFLMFSSFVKAQEEKASLFSNVDKTTMTIGDVLTYTIKVFLSDQSQSVDFSAQVESLH